MFLSKIWFVLVALLGGVFAMAALVAPRSADRRILELDGQRLDRAQYAAEQMLKTDAHRWIDYAAKLSRDAILAESLDAASRGSGEIKLIHDTVRGRIRALVPDVVGIGLEQLIAVDLTGRVIARVGQHEAEFGDSIGGLEVVDEALRGYLSDDVWGANAHLVRVGAVPVLAKSRDRIVGVLVVEAETGKRLANVWKKNLGVEVAILLRGQVTSSTMSEALLGSLAELVAQHKDEITSAKRTRPIAMVLGNDHLLGVAAPFAGQAAEQDAYYVLIGKQAPASDPMALITTTTADDLKFGHFPWIPLGGALLLVIVVGVTLQRAEAEKPLSRLRAEVQRLARSEISKLRDVDYSGKFGGIARDVNAAMERFTHAPRPSSDMAKKDIGAILGSGPIEPRHRKPTLPPFGGAPMPTLSVTQPPQMVPYPAPAGGYGTPMNIGLSQTSLSPLAAPPVPGGSALTAALGLGSPLPAVPQAPAPMYMPPPLPMAPPMPLPVKQPSPPGQSTAEEPLDADDLMEAGENTRARDSDETHFQQVFSEYVAAREQCGESSATLTLDKFRAKLAANKQQLIAKYGCRTARFAVYVKDGKAALTATPVK